MPQPPSSSPARIGTRGSDLALAQARQVQGWLAERLGLLAELVVIKTQGDKDQTRSVAALGAVGVFVKELERALQDGGADLAVHSLKDLPTEQPEGLVVAAHPVRVSPHELLLIHPGAHDAAAAPLPLARGARVGTSSERRRAQLLALRPDLEVAALRGNVPRRVELARRRELDAVLLAAAGVDRLALDLTGLVRVDLAPELLLPAPGQGALAIEARAADVELLRALTRLDDPRVRAEVEAERGLLHRLGAGCLVPLGALAAADPAGELVLNAVLQVNATAAPRPRLRRARVRAATPEAAAELARRVLDPPPLREEAAQPDLRGRTVLVVREPERAAELVEAIEDAGGSARCRPTTRIEALGAEEQARAALAALPPGGWVAFTSVSGVIALADAVRDLAGALELRRVGAVGPATARALAGRGVAVDVLAEPATGEGLAAALLARPQGADGQRAALLPTARGGRPELAAALAAAGWSVERVELYASVPAAPLAAEELAVDAVVLASPSAAEALFAAASPAPSCRVVAIGPTTAAAIAAAGHEVAATAEAPTPSGLLAALGRALGAAAQEGDRPC